jgi:2-polyprenyl-3-methyl-5-hydroxy-6-metoxy-1,4-benzoquinol methylase
MTIQFINQRRKNILRAAVEGDIKKIDPKKVLDNGCGKFGSWDYEKTPGISIEKTDIIYGQDSENLPFKDKTFDCVVFAGVVQYLNNPIRALNECRRVLRENGTLIIATINANSLFNSLFGFKAENITFTLNGMKHIIENFGFEIISERLIDFNLVPRNRRMIIYLICRKK